MADRTTTASPGAVGRFRGRSSTTTGTAPTTATPPGAIGRFVTNPTVTRTGVPTAGADTPAKAMLKMYLDDWGLGSLVEWAWGQLTSGASAEQVMLSLREQRDYKVRFAGNETRRQMGLPPLSESQYLAYESQARQMMRAAGLPSNLFDTPDDFAKYIGNDVSVSELAERVQFAASYASSDPTVNAETRAELQRLYGAGGVTAYYLDPERALPRLQREVAAAEAASAAQRAGFGQLSKAQAERVTDLSSSIQQTAQAFTQLARQRELMTALPGEVGTDAISADEQINAGLGGDAVASDKISRRARKRLADFEATQGNYQVGLTRSVTTAL